LGNTLIVLSGLLPFIHVLVPDVVTDEKVFGFSSWHRFLYSAGIHAGMLMFAFGMIILLSVLTERNVQEFRDRIIYCLLSPFMSAMFFMAWVFFPDIDYSVLAYLFIAMLIVGVSAAGIIQLIRFLTSLRTDSDTSSTTDTPHTITFDFRDREGY
jgi:uncharacterized membrane protein (GlpM family)